MNIGWTRAIGRNAKRLDPSSLRLVFVFLTCLLALPARLHTVVLGGDIMLNGIGIRQQALTGAAPVLRTADVAIANLEIPLTDAKAATSRKSAAELKARKQFVLKADPRHGASIAKAGIDVVSLGNNHCMDFRKTGLDQMRRTLAKIGVVYAGAGDDRVAALAPAVYRGRDGVRTGLVSALAFVGDGALWHCTPATDSTAGVAALAFSGRLDEAAAEVLRAAIADAKTRCDLLVVGLHWGIERQTVPTAYQVRLGRMCIDAGADVVWGCHPHVLQGAELYKGKPILYSMGNLVSSMPAETGLVRLAYDRSSFVRAEFVPYAISLGRIAASPKPAAARKAFARLCAFLQKRYPSPEAEALFRR